MDLLNALLIVTNCDSVEEFKNLSPAAKQSLANSLEDSIPSGFAAIEEWNEVLRLVMDAPPERENLAAKKKFLRYLRGAPVEKAAPQPSKGKWWQLKKK